MKLMRKLALCALLAMSLTYANADDTDAGTITCGSCTCSGATSTCSETCQTSCVLWVICHNDCKCSCNAT
jgi:hypothetical protein